LHRLKISDCLNLLSTRFNSEKSRFRTLGLLARIKRSEIKQNLMINNFYEPASKRYTNLSIGSNNLVPPLDSYDPCYWRNSEASPAFLSYQNFNQLPPLDSMIYFQQQRFKSSDRNPYSDYGSATPEECSDNYNPYKNLLHRNKSKDIEKVKPKKREQVKSACLNCRKSCKKCSLVRPCERCVTYGLESTCIDVARKSRGQGTRRRNVLSENPMSNILPFYIPPTFPLVKIE
jgi:hypothetical protein